jgi:hypothetical protein
VIPLAHIAGMPVEETIASLGPTLLLTLGAASTTLRARSRRTRSSNTRALSGMRARSGSGALTPRGPSGEAARGTIRGNIQIVHPVQKRGHIGRPGRIGRN